MGRHPRQLEDFIANLGIELRWRNLGSSVPSGFRQATTQRFEPVIHVDANRNTSPYLLTAPGLGEYADVGSPATPFHGGIGCHRSHAAIF